MIFCVEMVHEAAQIFTDHVMELVQRLSQRNSVNSFLQEIG